MKNTEGINGLKPKIKKLSFDTPGTIGVHLSDGRIVLVPLKLFPSIKKISRQQRTKYQIADEQIIIFKDCNEVFHLEQFLGKEMEYSYHFEKSVAAEPRIKYGRK